MSRYHVEYSSNNSGGGWWLKDADWYALAEAGWTVHWVKDDPYQTKWTDGGDRFLGALATSACRYVDTDGSESDAVRIASAMWQATTNQDPEDGGCSCCGRPHYFDTWDTECRWHGVPETAA